MLDSEPLGNNASNPTEVCCVDEVIFAFQPRGKQKAVYSKRYIPRKPHPNGLLCYLASFKTERGDPYIFDLDPDLVKDRPLNPKEVVKAMSARWDWNLPLNLLVEAGFQSSQVLDALKHHTLTVSVNQQHKKMAVRFVATFVPA